MSSEASGKRRTAMRTTGILTVALATVVAVSAVDTVSLAEAGAARRLERRDSKTTQPSNVAPGGAARDTTKDKLDKAVRDLESQDKIGNFEIQRSNSVPAGPSHVAPNGVAAKDVQPHDIPIIKYVDKASP
jgi:hypothetical protein